MTRVRVYVTLKPGILDPEGATVKHALEVLGYPEVCEVKVGKVLELTVDNNSDLESKIESMCERLLANPVIEEYSYEVVS